MKYIVDEFAEKNKYKFVLHSMGKGHKLP